MRTTTTRLSPILALFSLLFLTRCTGVVGESGFDGGDPISGDGGHNGGATGGRGLGGTTGTGSGGGPGNGTAARAQGAARRGRARDRDALRRAGAAADPLRQLPRATPVNGAPMPLVNLANLIAPSSSDPTQTFAAARAGPASS